MSNEYKIPFPDPNFDPEPKDQLFSERRSYRIPAGCFAIEVMANNPDPRIKELLRIPEDDPNPLELPEFPKNLRPVDMSELPISVCRDADSDEGQAAGWLVLYPDRVSAMADIDRRLILDFGSIDKIEKWLDLNLRMIRRIRSAAMEAK